MGLTLDELIERLQDIRDEHPQIGSHQIRFAYDYGDYWHTQVAASIQDVDVATMSQNDRLRLDAVIDEDRILQIQQEHIAEGVQPETDEDGKTNMTMDGNNIYECVLLI